MRFALMIEPQQDISWELNVAIAQRSEAAGIGTLYRSDHYESFPGAPGRRSTDAWASIAGLVRETSDLRHGTMVSPVTFRHPANIAKVVATVDEMSGGRVELGLGAGWHVDEHRRHGLAFPDRQARLEMMEEQFQVVSGLWSGEAGWSFRGKHYVVEDALYAPRPVQRPRPPLIMGTKGAPRGLRAAALWADHLNLYDIGPDTAREVFARFDDVCATLGRDPATVTRSVLCGIAVGSDRGEAERRGEAAAAVFGYASVAEWQRENGQLWAIGTPDQAIVRVREFASAGAELIILQDFLPEDLDHIDLLGALASEWSD
ncbi:LLM class F420-dependent oxidoreductase [soil metagenome]